MSKSHVKVPCVERIHFGAVDGKDLEDAEKPPRKRLERTANTPRKRLEKASILVLYDYVSKYYIITFWFNI